MLKDAEMLRKGEGNCRVGDNYSFCGFIPTVLSNLRKLQAAIPEGNWPVLNRHILNGHCTSNIKYKNIEVKKTRWISY